MGGGGGEAQLSEDAAVFLVVLLAAGVALPVFPVQAVGRYGTSSGFVEDDCGIEGQGRHEPGDAAQQGLGDGDEAEVLGADEAAPVFQPQGG